MSDTVGREGAVCRTLWGGREPCVGHCGEGGSRVLELASAVTHNGGTFRTTDPKGCRSGDEVWGQILGRRWGPLIVGGDEETGWQWRLISYMVSAISPVPLLSSRLGLVLYYSPGQQRLRLSLQRCAVSVAPL